METIQKQWLPRTLIGALAGLLLAAVCRGPLFFGGYSMPAFCQPLIHWAGRPWAIFITCALLFGLGAAAGIATLPFADSGRKLVLQSMIHFTFTCALWSLLLGVCFGVRKPMTWLVGLGALALLYVLIWLGRWVEWYREMLAIRKKLGLNRQKKEDKTP